MIYLITYDKNLFKSYQPLQQAIMSISEEWWHHLQNTWLIKTELNANQIFDRLKRTVSVNDRLLIIQIAPNVDYQGYLPQDAWDWIAENSLSVR